MKKFLLFLFSTILFSPVLSNAQCTITALSMTVCSTQPSVTVQATSTQFTTYQWTTSGTGTFISSTVLSPTYSPSAADITAGSVNLFVSASGGSCLVTTATTTITILASPTVNAGFDQTSCGVAPIALTTSSSNSTSVTWATTGTGTFSNLTTTTATYTPSPSDVTTGSATLTATATSIGGCITTDQAIMTMIASPTVNAGFDQTSCSVAPIGLNATISSGATLSWSKSGSGTFSNPTLANATYTPSPADVTSGTITLTATATNGVCTTLDQVVMTIVASPTVNAGFDVTYCPNTSIPLSDATAPNTTTLLWTTSGSGSFSNTTTLHPTYQLSSSDVATGNVTLTLKGTNNAGCLTTDNMIVTIFGKGIVNAGPDQFITNGSASLTGTMVGVNAVTWSSNGTGVFSNATSLTTTYTPSATDIINGIVKLTLTGDNGSCPPAVNQMLLSIGSDFTLSGIIMTSATTLDKGIVSLFKQTTTGLHYINSDTILAADAGTYSFAHIPAGTYVLYAAPIVGSTALNTYLPTYSGGTQTWNTAQTSVSQNFSYTIVLTAYTSADPTWNTGADIISGTITANVASSSNARITSIDVPAAYVTVYLNDVNGNKIAYTQTDVNGTYTFNNVKTGNYKVGPEFVGTGLPGTATSIPVVVDGLTSTIENGSMTLEERVSTTTGIIQMKSLSLNTYPNPTSSSISFDHNSNNTMGTIKLLNQTGAIQLQKEIEFNEPTITLNIESFPAGIYLLQVTTSNEVYTSKVIKY